MSRIAVGFAIFALFFAVSFAATSGLSKKASFNTTFAPDSQRKPSNFLEIADAVSQIEQDIKNPRIFNATTAAAYINALSAQAYGLGSAEFAPTGEAEQRLFLARADLMARQIHNIRVLLNERLGEFESSSTLGDQKLKEMVDSFRRAHRDLRYVTDYIAEWHHKLRPLKNSNAFFAGEGPLKIIDPIATNRNGELELKAGDLILVRGDSHVSATISRIGDTVTNMSHLAMVAIDEKGELRIVEALMEKNIISYGVNEFLALESLPRAEVYRFNGSETDAREAARSLWAIFRDSQANPEKYRFDIRMDVNDHSRVYCAEAMRMAWAHGTGGRVMIPNHLTTFSEALKTDFARGIQMEVSKSFAPSDIEVDSRFKLIAEHRDLDKIASTRRYDAIASKLFELFKAGFTYKIDALASSQATFAMFMKNFGFFRARIPADAKLSTVTTLLRHQRLVDSLMKKLTQAEAQVLAQNGGRPLAYRELESLFERACGTECLKRTSVAVEAISENGWPKAARTGFGSGAAGIDLGGCEAMFLRVD